jgi:hypothetical protein
VSQKDTHKVTEHLVGSTKCARAGSCRRGHFHPFEEKKGQRHFKVRAIDKLRGDSTFVCMDPARSHRGQEKPFGGFRA